MYSRYMGPPKINELKGVVGAPNNIIGESK